MLKLSEYRPESIHLNVEKHLISKAKFPVIDIHNHLLARNSATSDVGTKNKTKRLSAEELIELMDEFNIKMINDLDGMTGEDGENQWKSYAGKYPDRFSMFIRIDTTDVDDPNFVSQTTKRIDEWAKRGVAGLKFVKRLGLLYTDRTGKAVKPDDKRLKCIWETAAKNNLPVLIHIADPKAFFDPINGKNERYDELGEHPNWSYSDPKFYRFEELMDSQMNLLRDNPDTRFIIAHVGSNAEDLPRVDAMFKEFPNMYVDTAERIAELGRQPYSSRKFCMDWQDRILYGTDLIPNKTNVMGNYRFYETMDEYFDYNSWDEHNQGRWKIYGIGLPDDVLKKIYFGNALKVVPRLKDFYK